MFDELITDQHYGLVIGDEGLGRRNLLHEHPERKQFPFAWMTDFVGWLRCPSVNYGEVFTRRWVVEENTARALWSRRWVPGPFLVPGSGAC